MQLHDARFARMWEFYQAASEMAFLKQNLMNFQLTERQGIVPTTRNYIHRDQGMRSCDAAGSVEHTPSVLLHPQSQAEISKIYI